VITESGILKPEDVKTMRDNKVNCFLVGEAFMRAAEPASNWNGCSETRSSLSGLAPLSSGHIVLTLYWCFSF